VKHTRVCDLLGIKYPIIQGGMLWLATAELAAAVSNAGAMGVISPLAGMDMQGDPSANLVGELKKIKGMTHMPFGVNIPLDLTYAANLIEISIREKVKIVITAAGDPTRFSDVLKKEGIRVLHVISSVRQAEKAKSCGVDAVVAQGLEAAAHGGFDELPLFSLIPQVVDAVSIPVIAAGGISDARGLVASFSLGAEGVQLGTRFVAVEECIAHPNYKQAIIDARDTDTMITCRKIVPTRSLKTEFGSKLFALERSGAPRDEIVEFIGYRSNRMSQIDGKLDEGEAYCGSSAGLIKKILPAREVIAEMVDGYVMVIGRLK
jgi:enoyl-[acyl-carrier protein] reductase II